MTHRDRSIFPSKAPDDETTRCRFADCHLPATAALDLRPVCAAHHDFAIVLLTQIMHEFDVRSS